MRRREVFLHHLEQSTRRLELAIPSRAFDIFWRHYEMLVEANRSFNLTRITEPREAAIKHYADSLALLRWAEQTELAANPRRTEPFRVLDLGTGAGFPAIPLATVRPHWTIVAIDKAARKARFVRDCAEVLGLANLGALHARAQDWKPECPFDLVASRAVAKLSGCISASEHLVAPGGFLVCYKTASTPAEETEQGLTQCHRCGFNPLPHFDYVLHAEEPHPPRRLIAFRRDA